MASRMSCARPCRSGRHTIPAGKPSCTPCQRETQRRARAGLRAVRRPQPAYAHLGTLPADDVLAGAACYPDIAYLFDPSDQRGGSRAVTQRHDAAKAVCARCPVAQACFADAVAHERSGIFGGTLFAQGVPEKPLVQTVPSVSDSTAC